MATDTPRNPTRPVLFVAALLLMGTGLTGIAQAQPVIIPLQQQRPKDAPSPSPVPVAPPQAGPTDTAPVPTTAPVPPASKAPATGGGPDAPTNSNDSQ